jgi:hypothetical protein
LNLLELSRQHQLEHLIIVTFEQLSMLGVPVGATQSGIFDALDQTCRCFEQHYSQDVRTDRHWTEAFGGKDAFRAMNRHLAEQGHSSQLIVVSDHAVAVTDDFGFGNTRQCTLEDADAITSLRDLIDGQEMPAVLWIHIDSDSMADADSPGPQDDSTRIRRANLVADVRAECWSPEGIAARNGFIVSSCRGEHLPHPDMMNSCVSESLIRVPLWIGLGDQHVVRDQTLSGSFHIPPAVVQLLQPIDAVSVVPTEVTRTEETALQLVGDDFTAVRTSDAMAVRLRADPMDSGGEANAPIQLFLKPEDVWNINDQATVYATTLDELAPMLFAANDAGDH